ncbi:MAG: GNAT family N-acetyltransferase [Acidimicrobiales bacterium]|nr:GNAT family N-acetyltransferase [Acidimicrobiales bacterium]
MTLVIEDQLGSGRVYGVRISGAGPADIPPVLEMLARCSPESRLRRFHGPSDGVAYTQAQLARKEDIVRLAWGGDRCVGMGVVGLDRAGVPHLGALVEDAVQHRGVGRRLVRSLVAEARRRGLSSIHADVMGDNAGLVGALARLGEASVRMGSGLVSVDIKIDA